MASTRTRAAAAASNTTGRRTRAQQSPSQDVESSAPTSKKQKRNTTLQATNPEENGQLQDNGANQDRYENLDAMLTELMPPPASIPTSQRGRPSRQASAAAPHSEEAIVVNVPAVAATAAAADERSKEAATSTPTKPGQLKPVNKRARLIDRQDGAERVAFDSQGAAEDTSTTVPNGHNQNGLPAAAEAVDDPVSEDVGFQTDQRQPNTAGRRRAPRTRQVDTQSSSSSQAAIAQSQPEPQSTGETAADEGENGSIYDPAADEEEETVEEQDGDMSKARAATYMRDVKADAKHAVAKGGKIPQIRVQWTLQETEALMKHIAKLGCSWSKIKKFDEEAGGNLLSQRNQGDIKDKARNMKFDYLKAGWELPKNFEDIRLSRLMIDKLAQMGIIHEQDQQRQPRASQPESS